MSMSLKIFTARRYASAVLAVVMSVCVCVCPTQVGVLEIL